MGKVEKLQYITQSSEKEAILNEVRAVVDGGCKLVQLRMKESTESDIIEVAKVAKDICHSSGAKLIINDSVEVCKIVDADGVHLGKSDSSTEYARSILGSDKIVGRTCNTTDDIISLIGSEIDYIGVGPLRYTTTKKLLSPVIGLNGYEKLLKESATEFKIVAVGGITLEDIKPLIAQGVYGVAVSGAISRSENIAETTKKFVLEIDNKY
ncbi:MAG: thiamine phosphate synthase [Rikenellaceae bacterium]